MDFNWLDLAVVGVLVVSTLISLMRGFVRELISLGTWIAAGMLAVAFTPQLASYLTGIDIPSVRTAVAFILIFIAVLMAGWLIAFLARGLVTKTGLSGADRVLGMVFGLGRGVVIVAILVLLGDLTAISQDPKWDDSFMIAAFAGISQWMQGYFPHELLNRAKALL